MSFVHLHVHSQYSLLEATITAKTLCKQAAKFGQPAVALTDLGNLFGAVEFYFAALAEGIKPIVGLEVYLAPGSRFKKGEDRDALKIPNRRLVLLAKNHRGYQTLCQLSTIGYKEGFYYKPRVDEDVLKLHNEDIIALSGGLIGDVPWTFLNRGPEAALERVRFYQELYPESFYLELNRTGVIEWEKINPFLIEASKITGVPVVAANDVHYLNPEDQLAQEVLICVGSNKTLQDESRFRLGSDQFYFKSSSQMRELFKDVPEACDRTLEISDQIDLKFRFKDEKGQPIYHLPKYPTSNGQTDADEMRRLALLGLDRRIEEAEARGETSAREQKARYLERLEYELSVIDKMGFNGYFLIVQDFINWAKEQKIPVGPGRGSGAGSLVAYCLFITDLDPMPYNLIFERFLNPERISMPDFDIDFCQENRHRVIEYVTQKYGADSVSQIITYGKLQTRAAIRDVGRVLGMTFSEVDVISKLVPDKLGITLQEALDTEPRLKELTEQDPKIATLMDLALKVEGLVRHAGIHAAGVIIADGRLIDHAPLYRGVEGENVVQYDMKHAEKIGLIKFDFLGLKTLTHIQNALNLIEANRGKKIESFEISLNDPGIYEIMCKGDTAGIFQFESEGITDLIRKARPTQFEDIVAINALYRPGPMDMIPDYLARKHGEKKVEYAFPELEDVLKETYGVIVYQEQVQLIAARIANYSLGEADMLRRAMGKKIAEEMAQQKKRFMQGASENQHDPKASEELFDMMAEFAKYGFNKSHAAAYCVVAAQTAWIKHYYPVEFFAALLSTEMNDTDKVVKYVKDARRHGIQVKPPSVNESEYLFSVRGDDIYFSLGAIKGVGQSAVESILEARSHQPGRRFKTLEQFFEAVDLRKVNKKTIECLIKAGAFDDFGLKRSQLFESYQQFVEFADRQKRDREIGQGSLFDLLTGTEAKKGGGRQVQVEARAEWPRTAKLAYEKEVLGFYLSDHPLNGLQFLSAFSGAQAIENLFKIEAPPKKGPEVRALGVVSAKKEIITKKGTRMAFAQLEDQTGGLELIVFPDTFAKFELQLNSEEPVLVVGQYEGGEQGGKILVHSIETASASLAKVKKVSLRLEDPDPSMLPDLKQVFQAYQGEVQIEIQAWLSDLGQQVDLQIDGGIRPQPAFFESLQGAISGAANARVSLL